MLNTHTVNATNFDVQLTLIGTTLQAQTLNDFTELNGVDRLHWMLIMIYCSQAASLHILTYIQRCAL